MKRVDSDSYSLGYVVRSSPRLSTRRGNMERRRNWNHYELERDPIPIKPILRDFPLTQWLVCLLDGLLATGSGFEPNLLRFSECLFSGFKSERRRFRK